MNTITELNEVLANAISTMEIPWNDIHIWPREGS